MKDLKINYDKINLYLLYFIIFATPVAFCPQLYNSFDLFKLTILKYLLVLIYFFWILKVLKEEKIFLKFSSVDIILLLFFCLLIITTIFSIHRNLSLNELYMYLTFASFYLVVRNFIKQDTIIKFIYLMILSSVVVSIYGVLQHFKIDFVEWDDPVVSIRGASTLGNPDFISGFLSLIHPLILGLLLIEEKYYKKILLSAALLLNFSCVLWTYSRGGWICMVLSTIIILIFIGKEVLSKNKFLLFVLGIFSIFIIFILSREKVFFDKQETDIIKRAKSIVNLEYPSFKIRKFLWHDAILMIRERPIFGWGLNTYTYVFPKFRSKELSQLAGRMNLPENPHNEYLQIAQSTGLMGFFLLLWIVVYCIYIYIKKMKEKNKIDIIIYTGLIVFFLQSIFYFKIVSTFLFAIFFFAKLSSERRKIIKTIKFNFSKIFNYIAITSALLIMINLFINFSIPIIADYNFRKGEDYFANLKYESALKKYIIARELSPQNREYLFAVPAVYGMLCNMLSDADEENIYRKIYFYKRAEGEYKKILNYFPDDPFVYGGIGQIYLSLAQYEKKHEKKYLKKSIKYYKRACLLDKNNCLFYNDLGIAYLRNNQITLAIKNFKKAISLDNTFDMPYANLGLSYAMLKNKKLSEFYLKEAIKINPNNYQFFVQLGLIYFENKNYKLALLNFKKAQKLNPKDMGIKNTIKAITDKIKETSLKK